MQGTKICVKREGNVCTLYFDSVGGQPLPFNRFDEEPGTPQTLNYKELMERYGHLDLLFIERPTPPPTLHTPKTAKELAVIDAEIQAITGKPVARKIPIVEPIKTNKPQDGIILCDGVAKAILSAGITPPQAPEKVQGFLKMLQVARRYASEANEKILSIKIEAIEELMEEAWDVRREEKEKVASQKDEARRDKVASFQQIEAAEAEKIRNGAGY